MTRSPEAAVKVLPPSNPLPGLNLTLGITVVYLTVIVLVPIGALALKALRLSFGELWELATNERAISAYELSLGASLIAALINALFGSLLAWVLVRHRFPGPVSYTHLDVYKRQSAARSTARQGASRAIFQNPRQARR